MNRRSRKSEKGIALLVTTAGLIVIVPVIGLAIDAGFLYTISARLTAATDAAAIAAARSLSVGMTVAEQETEAKARARAFFDANFPDTQFNTSNKTVDVSVSETAFRTRTVAVESSVDAGLFFMRVLGREATTVRAEGQASRRDVNLMLVLDRSGSMDTAGACEPMKDAARTFVDHFANERDRLGLITFGMTYLDAFSPTQSFKPGLDQTLAQIDCSGGTGTAQALWRGFEELQAVNEPGALNLIVFFTDGLPNGITADFPIKRLSDNRYGHGWSPYDSTGATYYVDPSLCQDANGEKYDRRSWSGVRQYYAPSWNPFWNPPATVTGVMAAEGNGTKTTGYTFGVTHSQANSLTDHNENPVSMTGCGFSGNGWVVRRDIAYIPDTDAFNNTTSGYQHVDRFPAGHPYEGRIRPDTPINIGRASKNAADNAAYRMRTDPNSPAVIYTIGLGDPASGAPPDEEFMKRVANDPSSTTFDDRQPVGMYAFAPNSAQLAEAFYHVASEILRISH